MNIHKQHTLKCFQQKIYNKEIINLHFYAIREKYANNDSKNMILKMKNDLISFI